RRFKAVRASPLMWKARAISRLPALPSLSRRKVRISSREGRASSPRGRLAGAVRKPLLPLCGDLVGGSFLDIGGDFRSFPPRIKAAPPGEAFPSVQSARLFLYMLQDVELRQIGSGTNFEQP